VAGKTLMDQFRNFEEVVIQKYCSYKLNGKNLTIDMEFILMTGDVVGEPMDDKLKEYLALTPLALKEICKVRTPGYEDVKRRAVVILIHVQSSELRVSSENAVFQAVMIWAKRYPDRGNGKEREASYLEEPFLTIKS